MPATLLTDLERRTAGNLTIPRNVADLTNELRRDPYAPVSGESQVQSTLDALEAEGFVVNVGEHDSPGALVAAADGHERTISVPDEKAHNFENRLQVGSRAWRALGEQYFLTQDGFDALHVPVAGDVRPPKEVVEGLIAAEYRRVYGGDPSDLNESSSLGNALLEDEYAAWVDEVVADYKSATGLSLRVPIAGGAGYGDATELLILDPENAKGSAYTETAPWYMALVTTAVTDADTGSTITEAVYTGYARKSVAAADMNSAAAGSASNANAITFANCTAGTSSPVIGFAKCAASTVGRLIKYGTCASVTISPTQTPASFAAGAFTTTLD